jgi:hypothetical protein
MLSASSSSMTKISSAGDMKAAAILANPQSLKEQLERQRSDHQRTMSLTMMPEDGYGIDDVVSQYASLGFEVNQINGSTTYVLESRSSSGEVHSATSGGGGGREDGTATTSSNPLHILGELSGKGLDTGIKTTQAVYNIADSSIKNILTMSFSQLKKQKLSSLKDTMRRAKEKISEIPDPKSLTIHGTPPITTTSRKKAAMSSPTTTTNNDSKGSKDGYDIAWEEEEEEEENEEEESTNSKPHFVFDPPASRYEWRRTPIPAKFPGVVDHATLKNTSQYIFLNPSTSEVLCTTTAEALAMNKFVIIPKHPSNDFFIQFTNCLSYTTLEGCADQVSYALSNIPTVLTEEERHKFTWEAATERLIESSCITIKEARARRTENGMDKTDARIAYWLSESGEKSNMIRSLFSQKDE